MPKISSILNKAESFLKHKAQGGLMLLKICKPSAFRWSLLQLRLRDGPIFARNFLGFSLTAGIYLHSFSTSLFCLWIPSSCHSLSLDSGYPRLVFSRLSSASQPCPCLFRFLLAGGGGGRWSLGLGLERLCCRLGAGLPAGIPLTQ